MKERVVTLRKFIALAVALAVIVGFAVAITSSGEALSFSDLGIDTTVGNAMPPNQTQPQDFRRCGVAILLFRARFHLSDFHGHDR